jgi:serine/threonine-protein kinase
MPSTSVLKRALHQRHPEPFGRYQLLGRIASGGMAEVFVAFCGELEGLKTLVALKRILPVHAADETFVRLFQREASILVRLNHPAIARVFEVGKVGSSWFAAMELVQGETLAQVSRALTEAGQAWDPDLVAHIGAEVAHALHHAHTLRDSFGRPLGIVHRDISPQNVMLGFDGSVKVIDFGIARWEIPNTDSRTSGLRGKMQYVSPEQARGTQIDGRSDIFSLAAVLHECLSRDRLFYRGTTGATLDAVCYGSAPRLEGLERGLEQAIARALEKDPDERFSTANAFAQALQGGISGGRIVQAEDVGRLTSGLFPERVRRWKQIQEMAAAGLGFEEVLMPTTVRVWEAHTPVTDVGGKGAGPSARLGVVAAEGEYVSGAQAVPRRRGARERLRHLPLVAAGAGLFAAAFTVATFFGSPPEAPPRPPSGSPSAAPAPAPARRAPVLVPIPVPAAEPAPLPPAAPAEAAAAAAPVEAVEAAEPDPPPPEGEPPSTATATPMPTLAPAVAPAPPRRAPEERRAAKRSPRPAARTK